MKTKYAFTFTLILATTLLISQNISNYGVTVANISYNSIFDESPSYFIWPITTLEDDDYLSNVTNIGFNFTYNGQVYTQFKASVNGLITFNTSAVTVYEDASNGISGSYSNNPFQFYESTGTLNAIAPFYADLLLSTYIEGNNSDVNSTIAYKLTGTNPNRILTVEWKDCLYGIGGVANFQVKLYEIDNRIEFLYGNTNVIPITFDNNAIVPVTGINGGTILASYQPLQSELLNLSNEAPLEFSHSLTQNRASTPDTNIMLTFKLNLFDCAVNSIASNLTFPAVNHTNIQGRFNKSNHTFARYYVVRTLTNIAPTYSYDTGSSAYIFNNDLVYEGKDTTFTDDELNDNTTYYYWVYTSRSYNCSGNKPTISLVPLSASTTTLNCTGASGIFAIGPTGAYPSLTAAINNFEATGLGGPVTFELEAAYSTSVETYPIELSDEIPCLRLGNEILIRPKSTVSSAKVFSNANNSAILKIENASYITIDGRPGGTGINKYITFQNTDTLGSALQILQNSHHNIFEYCNFISVNRLLTEGTVVFDNLCPTCYENGPHDNTIDFCEIYSGATTAINAIYSKGAQDTISAIPIFSNINNIISNCNIRDYFSSSKSSNGIYLDKGSSHWTFFKNSFYQSSSRDYTATTVNSHRDLYVNSGTGHIIKGNSIGGRAIQTGGSFMELNGGMNYYSIMINQYVKNIYTGNSLIDVIEFDSIKIDSNFIQNIKLGTSKDVSFMKCSYGTFIVGEEDRNYIGGGAPSDSLILNTSGTSFLNLLYFYNNISCSFSNNSVLNISQLTTGNPISILSISPDYFFDHSNYAKIYNNDFGTSGTNSINLKNNSQYNYIIITSSDSPGLISYNIINFNSLGSGACYGIYNSEEQINVENNIVSNILSGGSIVGIFSAGKMYKNRISSIRSTGSFVGLYGLQSYSYASMESNEIERIEATISGSIYGLVGGGIKTNNKITLGYTTSNLPMTTNISIVGITVSDELTAYNTVYIGGNYNGNVNCYGVSFDDNEVQFQNNIIVNERSNLGIGFTGCINYYSIISIEPSIINNNLYYYSGTNTNFGRESFSNTTLNTLADWQERTTYDLQSAWYDPNFNSPPASLSLLNPTPAEGMAIPIESVPFDYFDAIRNIDSPDAGYDEGNYAGVDAIPPDISYTKLSAQCGTIDRTFTSIIADATGVYTTGAKRPRVYYKKNSGSYFDRVGSLQSGSLTNGTWSFTIQAADMGGLANNDTVYYFIVAQDTSAQDNLISLPAGAIGSETNILTDFPDYPNFYLISTAPALAGDYFVGAGQTYTTIRNAFTSYNNGCIADDVTFLLKDSIYNITTDTLKFNNTANESAKLLIKPTKTNTVITGNTSGGVLVFQSTQFITLDGSFNGIIYDECSDIQGNRNITIKNINNSTNSSVIYFTDEVLLKSFNHCSVRNCFIYGNNNQTKTGIYLNESSSLIKSTNISLHNNGIGACQIGIDVSGLTSSYLEAIDIIRNDLNYTTPNNIKQYGIVLNYVSDGIISGNKIDHIRRNDTKDVAGILGGFASNTTFINTSSGNTNGLINSTIKNNIIDSIVQTNTASAIGIAICRSSSENNILVANNMISHVMSNSINTDLCAGILTSYSITGSIYKFINNTIHMQGTIEGTTSANSYSTCFGLNSSVVSDIEIKNNIFINTQIGNSGATTKITSIGTYENNISAGYISDNNDLYATGNGPGTYAIASTNGFNTGILRNTITDWQNFAGRDTLSFNILPTFIDHNNLRLEKATTNAILDNSAESVSDIDRDIDCEYRNTSIPDIGADEFISCRFNLAADIAGAQGQTLEIIQDLNSSNIFYFDCEPMVSVIPNGVFPVSGNVATQLTLSDTSLFYLNRPLSKRYFDIKPNLFPNISTAAVILYFKQADFDQYNQVNGDYLELPRNKFDTLNVKNLRILQMHGTSSDGNPNNYTGTTVEIDPANTFIQWNSKLQAWAIAFNVYGFSGFFLSSAAPVCRTSNIQFVSNIMGGSTYKWQVNTGSGYNDLTNGGVYSGVNSDTITISSPPTTYRGYKYRCVVNNTFIGQENELLFSLKWNGTANVNWGNVSNWGCSTVPDIYTDVLIDSGTPFSPQVNVNAFARTLKLTPGVTLQVNSPRSLRVEQP